MPQKLICSAWVKNEMKPAEIVMCGQPAATIYQGSALCLRCYRMWAAEHIKQMAEKNDTLLERNIISEEDN